MPPRTINPGRPCLECRRRKIRCDRSFPCSYCVHTRIRCVYPPTEAGKRSAAQENRDLQDRIVNLEQRLSVLEQAVPTTRNLLQTPSDQPDSDSPHIDDGSLVRMGNHGESQNVQLPILFFLQGTR